TRRSSWSCGALSDEARLDELREHAARVEARHVREIHERANGALPIDEIEHRALGAWQLVETDAVDRDLVAKEHVVEIADARLDDAPLVDPTEAFHDDRRDRHAEPR